MFIARETEAESRKVGSHSSSHLVTPIPDAHWVPGAVLGVARVWPQLSPTPALEAGMLAPVMLMRTPTARRVGSRNQSLHVGAHHLLVSSHGTVCCGVTAP